MDKIFLVLSNLKHDGEVLEKGSVFQGAIETFQSLVDAGVVKVVEGAETLEQAAEMVKKEVDEVAAKAQAAVAAAPKDTWAPSAEKPVVADEAEKPAETTDTTEKPAETTETIVAPVVGTGDAPPPADDATNL